MAKFFQVKSEKSGEFVRAVKVDGGFQTGAAVGRPAELIPFSRAELADAAPAEKLEAPKAAAPKLAPVVGYIAPTKSGKPRELRIPEGDTFAAIADALDADAAKTVEFVGGHDVVLRYYADRIRQLVNRAPPVADKADDEGEFRQLVKDAVAAGLRKVFYDLARAVENGTV